MVRLFGAANSAGMNFEPLMTTCTVVHVIHSSTNHSAAPKPVQNCAPHVYRRDVNLIVKWRVHNSCGNLYTLVFPTALQLGNSGCGHAEVGTPFSQCTSHGNCITSSAQAMLTVLLACAMCARAVGSRANIYVLEIRTCKNYNTNPVKSACCLHLQVTTYFRKHQSCYTKECSEYIREIGRVGGGGEGGGRRGEGGGVGGGREEGGREGGREGGGREGGREGGRRMA